MANLNLYGDGQIVTGTVTVDPASIAAAATLDVNATVTGITTSDILLAFQPSVDLLADLEQAGIWVSAANTITVRLANNSAGALDQTSLTWRYAYLTSIG